MLAIVEVLSVLLAGVLAGEELLVRWGVQPALTSLEDHAHLLARQALVRRLRIVVPALMAPTTVLVVAALVLGGFGPGCVLRAVGTGCLVVFLLASFLGTVPINIRVDGWDAERPPADWKAVVRRWQRIDVLRSSAALAAFVFVLLALTRG